MTQRTPEGRDRRAGRRRQDQPDRGPVPRAGRALLDGGDHQRHIHARGCRIPDAGAGAAAGSDPGVETGGCPHTAIREDASINLAAVADLRLKHPDLDLILIESGGDNLAATFSPELADLSIYVIDTAAGQDIPRKRGPGVTRSDLLVVNKTDLAPYVGVDIAAGKPTRGGTGSSPYVMARLKAGSGLTRSCLSETEGGLMLDQI